MSQQFNKVSVTTLNSRAIDDDGVLGTSDDEDSEKWGQEQDKLFKEMKAKGKQMNNKDSDSGSGHEASIKLGNKRQMGNGNETAPVEKLINNAVNQAVKESKTTPPPMPPTAAKISYVTQPITFLPNIVWPHLKQSTEVNTIIVNGQNGTQNTALTKVNVTGTVGENLLVETAQTGKTEDTDKEKTFNMTKPSPGNPSSLNVPGKGSNINVVDTTNSPVNNEQNNNSPQPTAPQPAATTPAPATGGATQPQAATTGGGAQPTPMATQPQQPAATQPATQPVTQPMTQPMTQPVTQPATQPATMQPVTTPQPQNPANDQSIAVPNEQNILPTQPPTASVFMPFIPTTAVPLQASASSNVDQSAASIQPIPENNTIGNVSPTQPCVSPTESYSTLCPPTNTPPTPQTVQTTTAAPPATTQPTTTPTTIPVPKETTTVAPPQPIATSKKPEIQAVVNEKQSGNYEISFHTKVHNPSKSKNTVQIRPLHIGRTVTQSKNGGLIITSSSIYEVGHGFPLTNVDLKSIPEPLTESKLPQKTSSPAPATSPSTVPPTTTASPTTTKPPETTKPTLRPSTPPPSWMPTYSLLKSVHRSSSAKAKPEPEMNISEMLFPKLPSNLPIMIMEDHVAPLPLPHPLIAQAPNPVPLMDRGSFLQPSVALAQRAAEPTVSTSMFSQGSYPTTMLENASSDEDKDKILKIEEKPLQNCTTQPDEITVYPLPECKNAQLNSGLDISSSSEVLFDKKDGQSNIRRLNAQQSAINATEKPTQAEQPVKNKTEPDEIKIEDKKDGQSNNTNSQQPTENPVQAEQALKTTAETGEIKIEDKKDEQSSNLDTQQPTAKPAHEDKSENNTAKPDEMKIDAFKGIDDAVLSVDISELRPGEILSLKLPNSESRTLFKVREVKSSEKVSKFVNDQDSDAESNVAKKHMLYAVIEKLKNNKEYRDAMKSVISSADKRSDSKKETGDVPEKSVNKNESDDDEKTEEKLSQFLKDHSTSSKDGEMEPSLTNDQDIDEDAIKKSDVILPKARSHHHIKVTTKKEKLSKKKTEKQKSHLKQEGMGTSFAEELKKQDLIENDIKHISSLRKGKLSKSVRPRKEHKNVIIADVAGNVLYKGPLDIIALTSKKNKDKESKHQKGSSKRQRRSTDDEETNATKRDGTLYLTFKFEDKNNEKNGNGNNLSISKETIDQVSQLLSDALGKNVDRNVKIVNENKKEDNQKEQAKNKEELESKDKGSNESSTESSKERPSLEIKQKQNLTQVQIEDDEGNVLYKGPVDIEALNKTISTKNGEYSGYHLEKAGFITTMSSNPKAAEVVNKGLENTSSENSSVSNIHPRVSNRPRRHIKEDDKVSKKSKETKSNQKATSDKTNKGSDDLKSKEKATKKSSTSTEDPKADENNSPQTVTKGSNDQSKDTSQLPSHVIIEDERGNSLYQGPVDIFGMNKEASSKRKKKKWATSLTDALAQQIYSSQNTASNPGDGTSPKGKVITIQNVRTPLGEQKVSVQVENKDGSKPTQGTQPDSVDEKPTQSEKNPGKQSFFDIKNSKVLHRYVYNNTFKTEPKHQIEDKQNDDPNTQSILDKIIKQVQNRKKQNFDVTQTKVEKGDSSIGGRIVQAVAKPQGSPDAVEKATQSEYIKNVMQSWLNSKRVPSSEETKDSDEKPDNSSLMHDMIENWLKSKKIGIASNTENKEDGSGSGAEKQSTGNKVVIQNEPVENPSQQRANDQINKDENEIQGKATNNPGNSADEVNASVNGDNNIEVQTTMANGTVVLTTGGQSKLNSGPKGNELQPPFIAIPSKSATSDQVAVPDAPNKNQMSVILSAAGEDLKATDVHTKPGVEYSDALIQNLQNQNHLQAALPAGKTVAEQPAISNNGNNVAEPTYRIVKVSKEKLDELLQSSQESTHASPLNQQPQEPSSKGEPVAVILSNPYSDENKENQENLNSFRPVVGQAIPGNAQNNAINQAQSMTPNAQQVYNDQNTNSTLTDQDKSGLLLPNQFFQGDDEKILIGDEGKAVKTEPSAIGAFKSQQGATDLNVLLRAPGSTSPSFLIQSKNMSPLRISSNSDKGQESEISVLNAAGQRIECHTLPGQSSLTFLRCGSKTGQQTVSALPASQFTSNPLNIHQNDAPDQRPPSSETGAMNFLPSYMLPTGIKSNAAKTNNGSRGYGFGTVDDPSMYRKATKEIRNYLDKEMNEEKQMIQNLLIDSTSPKASLPAQEEEAQGPLVPFGFQYYPGAEESNMYNKETEYPGAYQYGENLNTHEHVGGLRGHPPYKARRPRRRHRLRFSERRLFTRSGPWTHKKSKTSTRKRHPSVQSWFVRRVFGPVQMILPPFYPQPCPWLLSKRCCSCCSNREIEEKEQAKDKDVKDKGTEKDKENDKDKDKEIDKEKEKDKEIDKDKEKDKESEKDKDKLKDDKYKDDSKNSASKPAVPKPCCDMSEWEYLGRVLCSCPCCMECLFW